MKTFYTILILLFIGFAAHAQLPDGSIAPDWTLTDMNGDSHNLYTVLDEGKSVIIDFSATWCGPCWSYHNTGNMETIYDQYGPEGTNQVEVYYIESDSATDDPCVYGQTVGCNAGTQGDWTDGTGYPIMNPPHEQVPQAYQVNAYPTLLAICPNKKLYEVGQASVSTWESWLLSTCALAQDFLVTDEECFGDNEGAIYLDVSGGVGNISFSWSNGQNTQDLEGIGAGTYSCTITEGRGHSIETGDIVVSGPLTPVLVETNLLSEVDCAGNSNGVISVEGSSDAGGISYLWNTGETEPTISDLGPGTYSVQVIDANGCMTEESYEISEPEVLGLSLNSVDENCDQLDGIIVASGNGGTQPYQYMIGDESSDTGFFEGMAAGAYFVDIIDANGCTWTEAIAIEAVEPPIAMAETNEELNCNSTQIIINGDGSTEGNGTIYQWTTEDGNIVDESNILNVVVDAPGTYMLEVTNALNGCTATTSVEVTANVDTPTSIAGENQTLDCINLSVTLDGSSSDNGDHIDYLWSTSNGNITGDNDSPITEANAAGTYTLLVTNTISGCSSTSSVQVEQSADVPTADAGESDQLTCSVNSITLNGSNSSSGADITYVWSTMDGNIVSGADGLNPVVDQAGTYLLEVLNGSNGCSALSSVSVVLNEAEPVIGVQGIDVLTCVITEGNLTVESDVETSEISWSTNDGTIDSGQDQAVCTISAPGTYQVMVTSSLTGCSSTTTYVVEENINTPFSAFDLNQNEFTIDLTSMATGENTTHVWDFGDGSTSTEINPSHIYAENGTFEVCLTIENECGSDKTCMTVNISLGSSLQLDLSTLNNTCFEACDGEYNIEPEDDIENYTIQVTGPNGYTSSLFSDQVCAGEYNYTLTNEIDESADGTFTITEPDLLEVETYVLNYIPCNGGEDGSIELNIVGGTGEYQVTWDNGMMGAMIDGLPAGEYEATLVDENGCSFSTVYELTEPEPIVLSDQAITNVTNESLGAIDITIEGGTPEYSFLWSHGEESEDVSDLDPGEYKVIITDMNGCKIELGPFKVLDQTVSTNDIEDLNDFMIYPNPVSENTTVYLEFNNQVDVKIELVNKLGQTVMTKKVRGQEISETFQVSDFSKGMYFVEITVLDETIVKKLMIQ